MIHHVDIFAHQTLNVIFLANVAVMFPVFRKVKYVQVRNRIIAINRGCLKRGTLSFLVDCHFLLLLQKKVTKEKESGKDNRSCFSPIAQCYFPLQKTGSGSHLFRFALAPHKKNAAILKLISVIVRLLIICEKKGDASPFQKPQVM